MTLWRRALEALGLVREPGATSLHPGWASSKLYAVVVVVLVLGVALNLFDGLDSWWNWFELLVGLVGAGLVGTAALQLRREGR